MGTLPPPAAVCRRSHATCEQNNVPHPDSGSSSGQAFEQRRREVAAVGVEIRVEGLTKRFGRQTIWEDVTMTIPEGEISVLLGPSGTGKSVFLKTLVGLLRPNAGHIWINGKDLPALNEHDLYQ